MAINFNPGDAVQVIDTNHHRSGHTGTLVRSDGAGLWHVQMCGLTLEQVSELLDESQFAPADRPDDWAVHVVRSNPLVANSHLYSDEQLQDILDFAARCVATARTTLDNYRVYDAVRTDLMAKRVNGSSQ